MSVLQPFLRYQKVVRVPPRSSRKRPTAPVEVVEAVSALPVVVEEALPPEVAEEAVPPVVEVVEVVLPVVEETPATEAPASELLATFLEGNSADVQEAIATGAYDAHVGELHALEEAGKKRKKVLAALEARIA